MFKSLRPLFIHKHLRVKRRYAICYPVDPCDPAVCVTILPNGVRVATEAQPSTLACFSLFAEAGSRYETACNNGIAHFIEHMAYKGFCGMSQSRLEKALLFMGAKMTAVTTREYQAFTAKCPPECTSEIVNILASIITDLELNDCAIGAEKYNICLEMVDADNDPKAVLFDYLHQTAFQGTPLAQSVIGPTRNIRKFDRDFAVNFLSQHYQPYKLCLAVAGNVNHEDIVRLADSRFCHMIGDPSGESDEGPNRFTGSQIIYRDDSMPFAHVAIALEAPGYTSPEYLSMFVASCIIGEWHKSQGCGLGNGTPLARAAACGDLCESFQTFYIAYRDIGLWGIYFVAKKLKLEDMVENVQNEWMKLCAMTQYTDMERGVNLAKLKLAKAVDGCANSCHDIGKQMMYTCTRKSLSDKFHELSQMKVTAIRESAERCLYDKCPAVVAVGPTENLPEYNRIRAGQYWLRL